MNIFHPKLLPQLFSILALGTMLMLMPTIPSFSSASGNITVNLGSSAYSGNATMTVYGEVVPPPGPGSQVALSILSPTGQTIGAANAIVNGTTGGYIFSFVLGGPYYTLNGTYTVTATSESGARQNMTFFYGCRFCKMYNTTSESVETTTDYFTITTVSDQTISKAATANISTITEPISTTLDFTSTTQVLVTSIKTVPAAPHSEFPASLALLIVFVIMAAVGMTLFFRFRK